MITGCNLRTVHFLFQIVPSNTSCRILKDICIRQITHVDSWWSLEGSSPFIPSDKNRRYQYITSVSMKTMLPIHVNRKQTLVCLLSAVQYNNSFCKCILPGIYRNIAFIQYRVCSYMFNCIISVKSLKTWKYNTYDYFEPSF